LENPLGNLKDITKPETLIEIERNGNVLWVNVDGICVLRISQMSDVPVHISSRLEFQKEHIINTLRPKRIQATQAMMI
jgi:hypothetical protein